MLSETHESVVRAAVREHWGLRGELRPIQAGAGSFTWQTGDYVIKLARATWPTSPLDWGPAR
jgi:hypothetical protein